MIIALGYKARVGKDTAADYLVNQYGFRRIAFADALKRTVMAAFDLTEDQVFGDAKLEVDPYWNATPVTLLQLVGTELFREHVSADHWVRVTMRVIDANPDVNWVITDCRFPNEAQAVKDRGGIVVRIDRDEQRRGATGRSQNHASETSMDGYTDWDWIVDNNDTLRGLFEAMDIVVEGPDEPIELNTELIADLPWNNE